MRFRPPFGTGSLNLRVGTGDEKVAYGNEVDFVGDDFSALTEVGFHVFTVMENAGVAPMPVIAIEIDPNISGVMDNFATLNYFPTPSLPGWSAYIDGTTSGSGAALAGVRRDTVRRGRSPLLLGRPAGTTQRR